MGRDTYYDIMGLSRSATPGDIKTRYRQLILKVHPDVNGTTVLFRQVQEAYEVLSDPSRRASYDRLLEPVGRAVSPTLHPEARWDAQRAWDPRTGRGSARTYRPSRAEGRILRGRHAFTSLVSRHPAATVAMAGVLLLVFGAALTEVGTALILVGAAALLTAGVAGLGRRGAKERRAYQRSGMAAVDAMTERQFESLLQNFFANKGYRVARIGGRGELGADLLLNDANGRMIVQARRWNRLVRPDAVHQAVSAMAHYRAARALVVTSSEYSSDAVTVAGASGVTLWSRGDLAAELTAFSGMRVQSGMERLTSELRTGSRLCLGFLAAIFVALVAAGTQVRRPSSGQRRQG